jgi:hypothetical protein
MIADMVFRPGIHIVPTHRCVYWADGLVDRRFRLLASTSLALLVNPLWIIGIKATEVISINLGLTGLCPIGNVLRLFGFTPMVGPDTSMRGKLYFLQTDRWYLERRVYVTVGVNIIIGSILFLAHAFGVGSIHRLPWHRHGLVRRDQVLRLG